MPCTPPRTRSSRARTGWSGSARGSGPDRRTPASIPGRQPRRGGFLAERVRRWNAMRGGSPAHRSPARVRGVVTRGASRGTGGTDCSGRAWRWPALCSPSASPWRCPRCARPLSSSSSAVGLTSSSSGGVPGHGGIEQQPDRLFGRRCQSEQRTQQPDQAAQATACPPSSSPSPSDEASSSRARAWPASTRPARPAAARAPARPAAARVPRQRHAAPAPRCATPPAAPRAPAPRRRRRRPTSYGTALSGRPRT